MGQQHWQGQVIQVVAIVAAVVIALRSCTWSRGGSMRR